jgi:hypothetical protein
MVAHEYIIANRRLDRDLEQLTREKAELVVAPAIRYMRILRTRAYGRSAQPEGLSRPAALPSAVEGLIVGP